VYSAEVAQRTFEWNIKRRGERLEQEAEEDGTACETSHGVLYKSEDGGAFL